MHRTHHTYRYPTPGSPAPSLHPHHYRHPHQRFHSPPNHHAHPHSYRPYSNSRPRLEHYQPVPRHPSPPRHIRHEREPSRLLPPIKVTRPSSPIVDAPPPLTAHPRRPRLPLHTRPVSSDGHGFAYSSDPELLTPLPYPYPSPPASRGVPNPPIKQEPREYPRDRYPDHSPVRLYHPYRRDSFPATPPLLRLDSPAMAPTDNRDRDRDQRALDRLPLLHISERDDVKSRVPLASSASPGDYSSDPYERYRRAMSPAERRFLQTMPISRSNSLTVYPVQQYGAWPNMDGTAVASGDAKPEGANIDPALSAVRSAAEAAAAANNAAQAAAAPEIRVQPETLGSATDSPAIEIDPPAQPLAAAAPPAPQTVPAPVPAAVAAAYKPDDPMNSLAPPGSDGTPKKETPFSRSPELRISHKLAERKRRKEMRDLFDELREQLPADRGMKASKWEILSKAVDYIAHLKHRVDEMQRINEALHRDLAVARGENPNTPWPPAYHSFGNIPSYVPPAHATNAAAAAATTPAAAAAPLTPAAVPPAPAAATTAAAVAAATATPAAAATPTPAPAPVVAPAPVASTAAPAPAPAAPTTPAVTTPVPTGTPTPAPAAAPQAAVPAPATTDPAAPKSS